MTGMSILTNSPAMQALQSLNSTRTALGIAESRAATGLKVASARDNGAAFAIATSQRSNISSLGVIRTSLERATSVLDVSLSAGASVSDILSQMKEKVLAASDTSIDTTSRDALSTDFSALVGQIRSIVYAADFNGINLIKEDADDLVVPVGLDGAVLTVQAQNLSLGTDGLWWNMPIASATLPFTTATEAESFIPAMDTAINRIGRRLASLGTDARAIEMQTANLDRLQDSMIAGVGNLVDADLAKESARIQSLQTRENLSVQSLSIANQAPRMLLSLFG